MNLAERFGRFSERGTPGTVGDVNDFYLKFVRFPGDCLWHRHESEDERFLVARGGAEHMPIAPEETPGMLIERMSTGNTGDARGERTVGAGRL